MTAEQKRLLSALAIEAALVVGYLDKGEEKDALVHARRVRDALADMAQAAHCCDTHAGCCVRAHNSCVCECSKCVRTRAALLLGETGTRPPSRPR